MEVGRNLEQDFNSKEINCRLRSLLKKCQNVFKEQLLEELPPRNTVDHAIKTGDASPVKKNAYSLSIQQLQ